MPIAARQIEDLYFSGCFTSAQVYGVDEWRSACPNLKTTSWSVQGGIKSGLSLEELRKRQASADPIFEPLAGGEIESGPWGQAREPYETYRELSSRPELSKPEQDLMGAKADVLLRVRLTPSRSRPTVTCRSRGPPPQIPWGSAPKFLRR